MNGIHLLVSTKENRNRDGNIRQTDKTPCCLLATELRPLFDRIYRGMSDTRPWMGMKILILVLTRRTGWFDRGLISGFNANESLDLMKYWLVAALLSICLARLTDLAYRISISSNTKILIDALNIFAEALVAMSIGKGDHYGLFRKRVRYLKTVGPFPVKWDFTQAYYSTIIDDNFNFVINTYC